MNTKIRTLSFICAFLLMFSLAGCNWGTNSGRRPRQASTSTQPANDQMVSSSSTESSSTRPSTSKPSTSSSTTAKPTTTKPSTSTSSTTHIHAWSDPSCNRPATCYCGATKGSALGHDWQEATCIAPKTCLRCGITTGGYGNHTWVEATYTSPKRCTVCGTTTGSKLPTVCTGITVVTAKTRYVFGENFDKEKLSVHLNYSDGSFNTIKGSSCSVIGFSSANLGKNTVTITYDEYSTKLDLEIVVDDISILDINAYEKNNADIVSNAYDCYGVYYDKCYEMDVNTFGDTYLTYRLAGHFNKFTGTLATVKTSRTAIFNVYADDKLIYSNTQINDITGAVTFEINVTGCNFLKIVVDNNDLLLANAYFKK